MAKDTPRDYGKLTIYQVCTRNHGANGTFDDVTNDLERIRSMGFDVLSIGFIRSFWDSDGITISCLYTP